jgi:hypothetical protein
MNAWQTVRMWPLVRSHPILPKQHWRERPLQVLLKGRPMAQPAPVGMPRLQPNVRRFEFVARTPETRIANIDCDQRT